MWSFYSLFLSSQSLSLGYNLSLLVEEVILFLFDFLWVLLTLVFLGYKMQIPVALVTMVLECTIFLFYPIGIRGTAHD